MQKQKEKKNSPNPGSQKKNGWIERLLKTIQFFSGSNKLSGTKQRTNDKKEKKENR